MNEIFLNISTYYHTSSLCGLDKLENKSAKITIKLSLDLNKTNFLRIGVGLTCNYLNIRESSEKNSETINPDSKISWK